MAEVPLVSLDTMIWIHSIARMAGHEITDRLLLAAADGKIRLVASWVLRAELQSDPAGNVDLRVRDTVEEILDNDAIRWVEVDRRVALAARDLSRSLLRRLGGADAIHLATAVLAEADFFVSVDRKFPYGATIDGCEVTEPKIVWPEDLFDAGAG